MTSSGSDILQQLDSLLGQRNQAWLLGAGVSVESNIPLMNALTKRVFSRAESENPLDHEVLKYIMSQLADDAHIEHVLSQIADHRAIAERSKTKEVIFDATKFTLDDLDKFHQRLLTWIAETVRWGFNAGNGTTTEQIGTRAQPIVSIDQHREFIGALFSKAQKGIEDRKTAVRFFTTNYDTLLEDALALETIPYWDGFGGGAVGFRNFCYGDSEPVHGVRACVVKLHGSVDWHLCDSGRVWRVRDGDIYPQRSARVLIYPQATKYVATQRDPFAAQFDLLRRTLSSKEENVLAICGYSFGDEHINQEIELAMEQANSQTTILAFTEKLPVTVEKWQKSRWSKRLYIMTPNGIFVGSDGPHAPPAAGGTHTWWTFKGVSRLLADGAEACAR